MHKKMNRMVPLAVSVVVLALAVCVKAQTRELKLSPGNVHWGYFDARLKPVLWIASGDTVRVETMLYGMDRLKLLGVPDAEIPNSLREVANSRTDQSPGGAPLTGPIYVEGAEPGDILEVRILGEFEFLHPYGWTQFRPGRGTLPDDFPYFRVKLIRFNPAAGTAEFRPGVTLKLAPFWGTIGVAPPIVGGRISIDPGPNGGNFDNKELVAGSTLYLPVHAPGALLSLADGHGMQGDGEISVAASETSLRGTVQVFVRKGKQIRWPRAETPTHFITMGLHPDLDEAARMAVREMIDFLATEKGMSREEAYLLCSLAVDLRVTQLVSSNKGIHAMLPKSIFQSPGRQD